MKIDRNIKVSDNPEPGTLIRIARENHLYWAVVTKPFNAGQSNAYVVLSGADTGPKFVGMLGREQRLDFPAAEIRFDHSDIAGRNDVPMVPGELLLVRGEPMVFVQSERMEWAISLATGEHEQTLLWGECLRLRRWRCVLPQADGSEITLFEINAA